MTTDATKETLKYQLLNKTWVVSRAKEGLLKQLQSKDGELGQLVINIPKDTGKKKKKI